MKKRGSRPWLSLPQFLVEIFDKNGASGSDSPPLLDAERMLLWYKHK